MLEIIYTHIIIHYCILYKLHTILTSGCRFEKTEILKKIELAQIDESTGTMVTRSGAAGQEGHKLVHKFQLHQLCNLCMWAGGRTVIHISCVCMWAGGRTVIHIHTYVPARRGLRNTQKLPRHCNRRVHNTMQRSHFWSQLLCKTQAVTPPPPHTKLTLHHRTRLKLRTGACKLKLCTCACKLKLCTGACKLKLRTGACKLKLRTGACKLKLHTST